MVETVSQVDREAAAKYFRTWTEPLEDLAVEALEGCHDDDEDSHVQAFARHRAASEAHTLRVAEAVREACAKAASSWDAIAIRALDIGRIVEGVGRGAEG